MLDVFKNLFGQATAPDHADLKKRGAQIVDVRSPEEFSRGHIPGALNLPLQTLERHLARLNKDRPVITCCASGVRSSAARSLLARHGFEVSNGGSWTSLARRLQA